MGTVEWSASVPTQHAQQHGARVARPRHGGAVWFTTGAADWGAPVCALKGQLRTVHVCARVSCGESMCEINRDGDWGTGEDGWRARARVDGGEVAAEGVTPRRTGEGGDRAR